MSRAKSKVRLTKKKVNKSIWIPIGMVLILPATFLIIAFLFRDEITLDKPTISEEIAKGVLALLIWLITTFLSEHLSNRKLLQKKIALKCEIFESLKIISEVLEKIIDFPEISFKNTPAENLRENDCLKQKFAKNINRLSSGIAKIVNRITGIDPEVTISCNDYLFSCYRLSNAICSYLDNPSANFMDQVKEESQNLKTLIDHQGINIQIKEELHS